MSRPRLSILTVVYRGQAHLRESVSSVLNQSFRDVELVAVDNASPDHGGEILDELARADPRLVVHRVDHSRALGEARNVALDAARGEYVWFVETPDVLASGALASVARRLEGSGVEALFVDHAREGPLGGEKAGRYRAAIRAASTAESFTLEDAPQLVDAGRDLWQLVFATDFLRSLGLRFAAGGLGELPVTYPALLAAERLAALASVCYARRELGNAVEDPRVHGTRFDAFDQYERVFRFADSREHLARRRRLLPPAMVRHYLSLLHELPEDGRRRFFAGMSASYSRHKGADDPPPESARGRLLVRLVERGSYGSYRALAAAANETRSARGRLDGLARRRAGATSVLRRGALERYYRTQLLRPVEPELAVFAAYWYRGYACNPRALYEKLGELAPSIRGVWIVNEDALASMPAGVDCVVAGTPAYYSTIARAKYLVNNVNFPNELVKREGTVHVQTHHGTPLKKMGLDLREAFVAGSRMNFELLLRRCARWDYSISSNPYSTFVWERACPARYETLEVGYPRNDVLVNATTADVDRARTELGIPGGATAILYAPTHREYRKRFVPTLDLGGVADELGSDYVIMTRLHYFYGSDPRLRELDDAGRIIDVSAHPSVERLCLAADVLLTDYSGTMFDYAVLDRPIVIHAPDWDVYRTLRGTYFDLLAEPPGIVTRSDDELVRAFGSGDVWSDGADRLRAAFRARFCALDDGAAAERVVRRVWLGQDGTDAPAAPARRATISA
ncbi:MAG: bifunctional glycosyltransferase family 2 protein/CDP-glycerol:glycerophosphate glycerophosphotransferase [Actinomycetota bacterium]|nr:bifunctional glycosyltransferase family 2 protein/CDP-glycerol:glycerophosphate glycerophosphotransferase [Actinomycetota bacterium]